MAVYGVARLGAARLGAFRLGYRQPTVKITINGTDRSTTRQVRIEGLTIRDYLDGAPNIATMRVSGFTPVAGHEVKVGLGSTHFGSLVFAGHIQQMVQIYEGEKPANVAYDLTCVSYEWLLNRRKVNGRFLSTSATAVVQSIMDDFTSGFTRRSVELGLEDLDEITFTNEGVTDALDRVAKRIGAYWYIDAGKDLHFFLDDVQGEVHDITTAAPKTAAGVTKATDLSQVRTRVFYEGGGAATPCAVAAGATLLPVDDLAWYPSTGGLVQVGPQRVAYTGTAPGGTGAIVGSSLGGPSAGLTPALRNGSGLSSGAYQYKYSFGTAGGETLCGPASAIITASTASVQNPSSAPHADWVTSTFYSLGTGGLTDQQNYSYKYTFYDAAGGGETGPSPASNVIFPFQGGNPATYVYYGLIQVAGLSAPPSGLTRRWYRTTGGGSTYKLIGSSAYEGFTGTVVISGVTYFYESVVDGSLGANAPSSGTLTAAQASLTNIAISASGSVTKRKVYRTTAGGGTYKLLTTINDNTTTIYTDSTADGSLGAVEPSTDTAGLTAADGTVLAGAVAIPVTAVAPFSATGGFARVGSQVVSYTSVSTTALTGVPATGAGSLGATVNYGSEALTVPVLTGIPAGGDGAILSAMLQGEAVNVVWQADDTAAQAVLAAADGTDGIAEEYFQDQRLSVTEAQNRAEAKLAELKDPLVTIRYNTRDQSTRSGYDVTLALAAPTSIAGTYKIQSVLLSDFDPLGQRWPLRQVEASSRRLAFENLLRQIRAT